MASTPMTVVETARFLQDAKRILSEEERGRLVLHVGLNPETGVVIPDSGGLRKLRWGLAGRGKRGGARVVYYFHGSSMPVVLLAAFGKNDRADLPASERIALKKGVARLVESFQRRPRETD